MTKRSRVAITETYELPSRGIIYGGSIPASITLRAMTTMEEKMRLSSTGMNVIPNLVKACIVEPEDIDIGKLKLSDLQFLMYKLRIITYGEDYKVSITCPHCGASLNNIHVNLDEIPVKYAEDDYVEPFEIGPLPISGDIISCTVLSSDDFIDIERDARRIRNKFPNYIGDPEFILSYQYKIEKINGDDIADALVQNYVENMHARDMRYFDSKYSEFVDSVGMDLGMTEVCSSCESDVDFVLPVTSEFFRPTYN